MIVGLSVGTLSLCFGSGNCPFPTVSCLGFSGSGRRVSF